MQITSSEKPQNPAHKELCAMVDQRVLFVTITVALIAIATVVASLLLVYGVQSYPSATANFLLGMGSCYVVMALSNVIYLVYKIKSCHGKNSFAYKTEDAAFQIVATIFLPFLAYIRGY